MSETIPTPPPIQDEAPKTPEEKVQQFKNELNKILNPELTDTERLKLIEDFFEKYYCQNSGQKEDGNMVSRCLGQWAPIGHEPTALPTSETLRSEFETSTYIFELNNPRDSKTGSKLTPTEAIFCYELTRIPIDISHLQIKPTDGICPSCNRAALLELDY